MSKLRSILTDCVHAELAKGRPSVDDVVRCAYDRHRSVFEEESERLIWQSAVRMVKDMMRDLADDEDETEQLALPGLHFPSAIAVRDDEGGFYYVRSDRAVWDELVAGMDERANHVTAAEAKLEVYRESMNIVRPVMEPDPKCTVAEAVRRMDGAS